MQASISRTCTHSSASFSLRTGERQAWDLSRFVKTLLFFNEPPKPAELLQNVMAQPGKLLQAVFAQSDEAKKEGVVTILAKPKVGAASSASTSQTQDVVLVTGATGGVGRRVVGRLLAQGRRVRALVRDAARGQEVMSKLPAAPGGQLELVVADVTQRRTLVPDMFRGVRQVVSCVGVRVQPKEQDVDRSKYYQGIKFYDPEIAGDTPETVDYLGLRNLLDAVKQHVGLEEGLLLLGSSTSGSGATQQQQQQQWGALDDVVMGGVSQSEMRMVSGAAEDGRGTAAVFRGDVSTSNSGGFASVRTRNYEPLLDVGAYEGIELRIKGDGQRYKAIIRTDTNWDGIGYCKSFDTEPGVWQTVQLRFADFVPVFRARTVRDGQRLDPSGIASIQLMLSKFEYDGQLNPAFRAGRFELPIDSIRAYLPQPLAPRFVHVSSAGVTRLDRPGINLADEPAIIGLSDRLGGLLTYKLRGEDAVRDSGVPHAVVRPCALTEEPAGAPLQIDQGDVIKGKIGRDDLAELCVALLSQPQTLDTTFEVKSTIPLAEPWTGSPSGSAETRDWQQILASAKLQQGVTGKTIDGVYTGRSPQPVAAR